MTLKKICILLVGTIFDGQGDCQMGFGPQYSHMIKSLSTTIALWGP